MERENNFSRSVWFCENVTEILNRLIEIQAPIRESILVRPVWSDRASTLFSGLLKQDCPRVWCMPSDGYPPDQDVIVDGGVRDGMRVCHASSATAARVVVVLHDDPALLQSVLDEYLDSSDVTLFCLKTAWYGQNRPVFLTSIPKSGTHLMFGLLESLGFARGSHSDAGHYAPGHYHPLTADFFHGPALKWFTAQSLAGALSHPAMHHPICFGYRNPLDTLVSEADYYVQPRRTILPYYFGCLGARNRVIEELCRGSALDPVSVRMEQYLPWFRLPNVIPVAYEEVVGGKGEASDAVQRDLIWSLQLKLHVSGSPGEYVGRLYNTASSTYNVGRINRFRDTCLNDPAFLSRHPDVLEMVEAFGYGHTLPGRALPGASPMPAGRPYLRWSGPYDLGGDAVRVVGHALCFRDRAGGFFALPTAFADLDFQIIPPRKLPGCLTAPDLNGMAVAAAEPAYQARAQAAGAVGECLGFTIHGVDGAFVAVPRTVDACVLAELMRNTLVRGDSRESCEKALMTSIGQVMQSGRVDKPFIIRRSHDSNMVFYDGIVYIVPLSEGFVSFSSAPEDRERFGAFQTLNGESDLTGLFHDHDAEMMRVFLRALCE